MLLWLNKKRRVFFSIFVVGHQRKTLTGEWSLATTVVYTTSYVVHKWDTPEIPWPVISSHDIDHIDDFVQDCSNSIANALELRQCCTKPSICDQQVVVLHKGEFELPA